MTENLSVALYFNENMEQLDTKDIITTELNIPSTPFQNNWIGGSDGIPPIFAGSDIEQKQITVKVLLLSHDYFDYPLLRDKLYSVFGFNKPFYIIDKRQPTKRHKIVLESGFLPDKQSVIHGTVSVPFITDRLPFAESVGTTQDIQTNGINSEDGLWGFGMGLIDDPNSLVYAYTGTSFKVYNAGDVSIHPFEQDLKITISNILGANNGFTLKNKTNGTEFTVTEAVTSSKNIVIDGPNVTSNGLAFLRSTNKKFIELVPGWNEFEITGATDAKTEFDFRFYYQ